MKSKESKQRMYAGLLFLGACILIYRTVTMMVHGDLRILTPWVSVLLIAEFLVDLTCAIFCVRWFIFNDASHDRIPLRLGAAAAILHAIRVLVFVLGRIGPWINFDVRPEHHELHYTRWNMGQVYFAATMAVLGVMGVLVIWYYRRKAGKDPEKNNGGA